MEPWRERYRIGDRVRIVRAKRLNGVRGTVTVIHQLSRHVTVLWDDDGLELPISVENIELCGTFETALREIVDAEI